MGARFGVEGARWEGGLVGESRWDRGREVRSKNMVLRSLTKCE